MKRGIIYLVSIVFMLSSCGKTSNKGSHYKNAERGYALENLKDSLDNLAANIPGEVGIALITDRNDTLLVNNNVKYPLMSVFKLHQGISLCRLSEEIGMSLDSVITLNRESLNPDTWSPMLKDYDDQEIRLPIRRLLEYSLQQSDNNASNYLFQTFEPVAKVDSLISTLIPRESFRLTVTEEEMWGNHSLCYENWSSPLGAAILIDRLFTDSILSADNQKFLQVTLLECKTGTDRIVAPLANKEGVKVAHKTGSGFRNEKGVLTAHNDVAYIMLPDGRHYTLAVLVKDFHGSEKEAAQVIARISSLVYDAIQKL